ncbi:MAG TPA: CvpA family protein [Flavobacteriaceae bacterium]|nr:CvpA family protein [Flavobacteriaceae bacterium]
MNVIDIVLGVILLFGLIRGLMKGFFVELASLLALLAGIYIALHFSHILKNFIWPYLSWEEKYVQLLAFALTFILVVLLISLLGRLLTQVSSLVALGLVNKLLGAIFGFLKMAFLLSIVILFFENINRNGDLIERKKIEMSVLYGPVKSLVPILLPTLLEFAQENQWLKDDEPQEERK